MKRIILPVIVFASTLAAADPGSVATASDLKEKPFLDAATLTRLPKDSLVDIQTRQGAWAQVKTGDSKIGWLKIMVLRSGVASTGGGLSGLGQLANVAATGSSGNTTTTGVKGLSAEQIKNARPNPQEVERMNSYAVGGQDAQRFANATKLLQQSVAAIELPKETVQQNRNSSSD